jgi:medium-chain acyl-[acyl-carrier-protein] hydrolase
MSIYRIDYTILSSDTDANRRLRLSRLFTMLQEASIAHTTALGMGREMTLDRGLLWIVTLQQARIQRLPEYDEQIRLVSWPGRMMHLLFPRYYRIEDKKGNALVEASALWALMDQKTRRIVFPELYGVKIRGVHTGKEIPLPVAPKPPQNGETGNFTVPCSFVDLNGHMNNTRYFDLAEDRMPKALRSLPLAAVQAEYAKEATEGEMILLKSEAAPDAYLLSGEQNGAKLFRLSLTYQGGHHE